VTNGIAVGDNVYVLTGGYPIRGKVIEIDDQPFLTFIHEGPML
jgi:hypothetical protein